MNIASDARRLSHFAAMFLAAGAVREPAMADDRVDDRARVARLATVGKEIFRDTGLSSPKGQACVTCHVPETAFADSKPLSPGAVTGRFGKRNAPSLMYAALIPNMEQEDFTRENGEQEWVWQGGLFQDGSARTLDEQVREPLFNHVEMNLGGESDFAAKLRSAAYAPLLHDGMTESEWQNDGDVARVAYRALVEFLKEPMFRPFDARIDDFLAGDENALSEQEKRGLDVFRNAGKCADCHFLHSTMWPRPLLSDYGYDNLGVPSLGAKDPGLGGHTRASEEIGMFRAPGLRNVALTAPYFHNGSVATLKEVMEFYNRRDLETERWGKTDYPETVNRKDLGDLKLSEQQISDLVALMDAFTDRSLVEMKLKRAEFPEVPTGTPTSWEMRAYFPDWNYSAAPLPPHPPYRGDLLTKPILTPELLSE